MSASAAWRFIEHLFTPEVLGSFNHQLGTVPSRRDAIIAGVGSPTGLHEAVFRLGGRTPELFDVARRYMQWPNNPFVSVLSGLGDVRSFMEMVHEAYQEALDAKADE